MPPEIIAALLSHGGWAIGCAVLLLLWLRERQEVRRLNEAMVSFAREFGGAVKENTAATEALGGKIGELVTRRRSR